MKQRVISGVIIFILAVALGLTGGIPLAAVLAVCSMIGFYEMTRVLQVHGKEERFNVLEVTGEVWAALYWVLLVYLSMKDNTDRFVSEANSLDLLCIFGVFFVNMGIYVFTFPKYEATQVIGSVFAFLYIPIMISCIYRSIFLPAGRFVYALIFFCSWICDTCAWAVGRLCGRHKMAPVLSPKKTVEGAIGGIAGSTALCAGAAAVVRMLYPGTDFMAEFIIIGIAGSIISMTGDLAASAIKRNHNIKDYGKIIPGHGGIMDRFDSIIFTAPAIYYLGVLLLTILP